MKNDHTTSGYNRYDNNTMSKHRYVHSKIEQSPQTIKYVNNTPFFYYEHSSEPLCYGSGNSVKEFSLGKPSRIRRGHLFSKGDDAPTSKESNKENILLEKRLDDLKKIRGDYVRLIENELLERNRYNQCEYNTINEDMTLLLNDDTKINGSFINTPSKTRLNAKYNNNNRSDNKNRRDDSILMNSSNMINSFDKVVSDRMHNNNDSLFIKSYEFPRLMKRKTNRSYTKVLIPVCMSVI